MGFDQQSGPDLAPAEGRDAEGVHEQMCALTTWFVRNAAFSDDFLSDHHGALASRHLDDILADLVAMKYGAMCGALSVFMARTAKRSGYDAIELNFGNNDVRSHVLVLVAVGHGARIVYDPTFGCFSGRTDGTPASIQTIIDLLRQDRGDELRWIEIGPRERALMFRTGVPARLPLTSSVRRLDQSRSVAMYDLKLAGSVAWHEIWTWGRLQKPGLRTIFDCLRFPLSTSGEAEAEALADQLRGIS